MTSAMVDPLLISHPIELSNRLISCLALIVQTRSSVYTALTNLPEGDCKAAEQGNMRYTRRRISRPQDLVR